MKHYFLYGGLVCLVLAGTSFLGIQQDTLTLLFTACGHLAVGAYLHFIAPRL